jgi:hypothetical protein
MQRIVIFYNVFLLKNVSLWVSVLWRVKSSDWWVSLPDLSLFCTHDYICTRENLGGKTQKVLKQGGVLLPQTLPKSWMHDFLVCWNRDSKDSTTVWNGLSFHLGWGYSLECPTTCLNSQAFHMRLISCHRFKYYFLKSFVEIYFMNQKAYLLKVYDSMTFSTTTDLGSDPWFWGTYINI